MADGLVEAAAKDEHKRAEVEALNRLIETERNRANAVFDHAVDGILVVAPNGSISRMNPSAKEIFDLAGASVSGHMASDLRSSPDAQAHELLELAASAGAAGVEMVARRSDGVTLPVHVTALATATMATSATRSWSETSLSGRRSNNSCTIRQPMMRLPDCRIGTMHGTTSDCCWSQTMLTRGRLASCSSTSIHSRL